MATTTIEYGRPAFIVDRFREDIDQGHQIDWANVPDSYKNATTGKKVIPAGKVMKRSTGHTYANSHDSDPMIPAAAAADTEVIGLLATDAREGSETAALTGYGIVTSGTVYENLLPDATGGPPKTLAAGYKTSLNAAGRGFTFRLYHDSRAAV
jgi:hypothetical protein